MRSKQYQIGPIKVNLPDENQGYFSIFEDLAEFFGKEYQSDAVKSLRSKLKDIKPKASIDYEADFTHITTTNVDTLISVINAIIELSKDKYEEDYSKIDYVALREIFLQSKKNRPKPVVWQTGDVFAIPLADKTFSFGQILDKKYCTCVLFNYKSDKPELSELNYLELQPLSILHLSNGDLLNNGQWSIIFNKQVRLDPNIGHGGKGGDYRKYIL